MNIITNIARAADNPVVSCSGGDCSLCSLLETISNVYNFFLAVSFAVAILVLVIAGVSYMINGGDKSKIQKSLRYLKSGLGGFALIILGWIIIQTSVNLAGYENAGSWWNFRCGQENGQGSINGTGSQLSLQNSYYKNLPTFSNLTSYLKSGTKIAKLAGPTDAQSFATQLNNLQDGEILHFLAPVRLDSINGEEDIFLPLLTAIKNGESLQLESTGEYWNLIQNQWPQLRDSLSGLTEEEKQLLDQYFGQNSYTDNRSLVNQDGSLVDASSNADDLSALYKSLAGILAGSQDQGNLQNMSLSELIAMAESGSQTDNQDGTGQFIGVLTAETLKLANLVLVDKESSSDVLSSASASCQNSGGEWVDKTCVCPTESTLGQDQACHDNTELKANCEKSQGTWKKVTDGYNPAPLCGSLNSELSELIQNTLNSGDQRADSSQIVSDKEYCQCDVNDCIDESGTCLNKDQDSDGDKIANSKDRCPETPASEKGAVNQDLGGEYYGCGCSEIGMVKKECPPEQCVGDNLVTYPSGKRECKDGKLLSYSCQPLERNFNTTCADKNKTAQGDNSGSLYDVNSNTNGSFVFGNVNGNTNSAFAKNPSDSLGNNNSSGNPISSPNGSGKAKPGKDDFMKDPGPNVPPGDGESGHNTPRGNGTPEAIKAALRRINDRDPLRYEMIFRNVQTIDRTAFPGGMCDGCGHFEVNATLPLGIMDQVIVHESTHAAQACTTGWWGSMANVERIACANQMGSLDRTEGHEDMKEFPRQRMSIEYKGKEVRGYLSRRVMINTNEGPSPKGDLGTAAYHWPVAYALSYGDTTMGPYHYGEHSSKLILGLTANEEKTVRQIMESEKKCLSKPTKDLPPVKACEDASREIQIR